MNTNNTYSFENLSLDDLKTVMSKIYKGANQQEVIQATDYLTAFGSTIQSVPIFVQLVTQESVNEIRLLAAVLLKKHIGPHLKTMGNEDRQTLQNGMLARFFDEPLRKIKRTLAVLISVMMKKGFELEQPWTEPLMILSQKIKADQSEETRLQGFLLLSTILEFTGEHLSAFYEDLFKFFFETMADNSAIIRKQTMLCVLNMYTSVSEVILIDSFTHIYPMILECFYQSLQEEDEDTIEKTLEMLSALTQQRNDLFDNSKLTKLIEIFCTNQGLLSKTLNPLFIEAMIDILQNIVISFKSVITKSETMLRKIVEIIFTLASRKEDRDNTEEKESIQDVALFFIRQAGQYLPKKKSYPIFKEYLIKMFASENTQVVEGAFMALGELAEGCVEYLKRDLPTIMKSFIQKGLESTNSEIKQATFYTINMFASFLSPDVMVYHPMIVPVLIKNLDMTDQKGLLSNVQSLVLFCDEMTDSIMGYIPELIPRLINVVDKAENQIIVKSCAIQAIASCAEAAEDKFAQYASELLPLLAQLININEKDYISIKSTATKCVGLIIGHCLKNNPDIVANSLESLISTIYDSFKATENTELKENSFVFFYNLATFLGAGFKPYLEKIIGLVFSTFENQQKLQEVRKPKVISLDSDSEDENDPNNFYVDENIVEELSAAICCLGEMALACPSEYGPYYEKTVEVLSSYAKFFHYTVRTQVLRCYKNLAVAIVKLGNGGDIPKFTHGVPCKRFSADAEKFLYGEVYDKLLDTFETDEHIQLLITATEVIQEFCMDLGPAAVDQKLDEIVHHLIKIFKNDTNAQNQAYEGEEEVHSELFGSTTLVVDLLIKVCREGFLSHFDKIYPELKKFAVSEDIAEDDVAEVIGCFAQAVKYMPSAAQIYGLDMLDICVKALEFGDEYINNNVAYCMGLVVEAGKEKIYDHYRVIMEKLRVIFENSMLPDTRDNAISSLARMVYTNPSLVPLKMVLPNLMSEMPLKGDFKEHRTCVKMLIFLLETDPTVLSEMEGKCVDLLIDAIVERKKYKIKDENMIKAIGMILKNLSGNESGKQMIQECASKLSQENVDILTQLLSAQY